MQQVAPCIYMFSGTLAGHVYLIDDRGDRTAFTLIDAGLPNVPPKIFEQMRAEDLPIERINRIIITHAHPDHIGGLSALQGMTGATVLSSHLEREVIEGRRPVPLPERGTVPISARVLVPPSISMQPATVDRTLDDGDVIYGPLGELTVVATPGHSPGHISLWNAAHRILFAGDTLFHLRGRLRLPYAFMTVDMQQNLHSIERLARLGPRTVMFGHGEPLLDHAEVAIGRFLYEERRAMAP